MLDIKCCIWQHRERENKGAPTMTTKLATDVWNSEWHVTSKGDTIAFDYDISEDGATVEIIVGIDSERAKFVESVYEQTVPYADAGTEVGRAVDAAGVWFWENHGKLPRDFRAIARAFVRHFSEHYQSR